jgi:hypothetical protein
MWSNFRAKKDSGFLTSLWHKAMAIKIWRSKANKTTNLTYLGHEGQPLKTIIHMCWECPRAKVAWPWVLSFVYRLKFSTNVDKLYKGLEMEHCFFNKQIVEENSTIQPILDII